MVKIISIVFIVLSFMFAVKAQEINNDENSVTVFKLGLNFYETNQYNEAVEMFNKITNASILTSRTTAAYLFKGKTLLKLKKYDDAVSELKSFIEKFPASNYLDEAKITIAKIYLEKEEYISALKEIAAIVEETESPYYNSYAKTSGEKIALHFLQSSQVKNLYQTYTGGKAKPYLLYVLGKVYLKEKNYSQASQTFSKILSEFPLSEERSSAVSLYQDASNEKQTASSKDLIGVMFPVDADSITSATPVSEILEGIKFAVSSYNTENEDKVGLVIRNTERNADKIDAIKNEFEKIPGLKTIIGPIYSDEVRTALTDFKTNDLPIISPTATDNGLTALNPNFYQANPSFEVRGKVMAQYIYYVENKRKMGVLNANSGYSPLLANSFIDEFEKLGGQILVHETYTSKDFSFSSQFSRISTYVNSLEGLYIPLVDRTDAPVILAQLVQSQLNISIYGNQDWFLAKGYETSPEISNKLTFTSDYFIDYNDYDFQQFSRKFLAKTHLDANRNVLYGYDAANFILHVIGKNNSRKNIEQTIESGVTVNGFHNNLSFSKQRVNRFLNIVRYRDGVFELVDKFKANLQ